jgi:hypothetical protein
MPADEDSRLAFEWELFRYSPRDWFLLSGDRLLISALSLLAIFGIVVGLVVVGLVPFRDNIALLYMLFAFVSGNFTAITIVISLSQFVLTRHLESPGEIREKIAEMLAYRADVSETTRQEVLPISPTDFFLILFRNIREDAAELEGQVSQGRTRKMREELATLTDGLQEHTDDVIGLLERPSAGIEHALFTTMESDYGQFVHRAWYLQSEYSDDLADPALEPLQRLVDRFEHVEVATRLFRTSRIQAELATLSQLLLYVGLPVQVVTVVLMMTFTAPGGIPFSTPVLSVVFPVVVTAGFTPFVVLAAYVMRLTTMARRTADMYPFSSRVRGKLAVEQVDPLPRDASRWRRRDDAETDRSERRSRVRER